MQRQRRTSDQLDDQPAGVLCRRYTLYVSRPEHMWFPCSSHLTGGHMAGGCSICAERCHLATVLGCWEEGGRGPRKDPTRACVCVENEQGPLYSRKPLSAHWQHRLPRASPPSRVSASSDVAVSLFTQLPYRFPLSSQHPLRAMAANGLNSTYSCHCLNVRITHQPTSETAPQADKDFASVHCGDSGITIVRPAQQHPRRPEEFTPWSSPMFRLHSGVEVVPCPIRMARCRGVLDSSPSHALYATKWCTESTRSFPPRRMVEKGLSYTAMIGQSRMC